MNYICYCLKKDRKTYVGCTNNFNRRIRQHNGELVGGAKYTTKNGPGWNPILFAVGFRDNHDALSFEWHWKFQSRKLKSREKALDHLLTNPVFSHVVKGYENPHSTVPHRS